MAALLLFSGALLNWDELQVALRARWSTTTPHPAWCGVVVPVGDVEQRVLVERGTDRRLHILVRVCSEATIRPADALRYNTFARHGVMTLHRDAYLLREVVPLDRLECDEVLALVESMVAEASRLRSAIRRTDAGERAFGHFGD